MVTHGFLKSEIEMHQEFQHSDNHA